MNVKKTKLFVRLQHHVKLILQNVPSGNYSSTEVDLKALSIDDLSAIDKEVFF